VSEPPEIRITRGAPTPEEEAAVRAAILKIWRDEQASARRTSGESAWTLAGRAASTRTLPRDLTSEHAWRMSLLFDGGPMTARRTGRGDSK
jgi:hypothetical protein